MLLAAPLFGGAASADIIPPGHRGVVHELVLEAEPAQLEGWKLVAAPYPGLNGVTPVEPGVPFRFSSKYGTRLYAVAVGEPLPTSLADGWTHEHPGTGFGVAEISSVPVLNPLQKLTTSLRLVDITPERLRLEVVGEQRERRVGELAVRAGVVFLPLGLALLWLWRLKLRRLRSDQRAS